MKIVVVVIFGLALLAAAPLQAQSGKIPHSKDTINATGDGNSVGSRGRPADLAGTSLKVGDKLPSASLVKIDMSVVDIGNNGGKVRILNVVPSLDTTTCDEQTHELSETNEGLDKQVEMVTISVDLPFAQRRYTKSGEFKNVTFLSDYRGNAFGKGTGLLLKQSQLLARAVLVVDKDNVIRYMQVMPDMSFLPDMQTAFKVARGLM
jgi:thiol peroxidase